MALRLDAEVSVDETEIDRIVAELQQETPIQYVLGAEWFGHLQLKVNSHVLIPRPETEELVRWIADDWRSSSASPCRLIDIGTGSGCIPIWLKTQCPQLDVTAVDISKSALAVAEENARRYDAAIQFEYFDILQDDATLPGLFDIIVSNPPYITEAERSDMQLRVLAHEPHEALFVTDGDPLQFYKAILHFAHHNLSKDGAIYLELGSLHAETVRDFFMQHYYDAELRKDMYGHFRMLKAVKKILP